MGNHLLMQLLTFRNYSSPNFSIISPSQPFNSLCLSVTKTREENGSHLHRHSLGHHLAPLGVFLKFGCQVLDFQLSKLIMVCVNWMIEFRITFWIQIDFIYSFHLCNTPCPIAEWWHDDAGGVLDLFGADFFRLPSWNCLCCLCHHQVIIHSGKYHLSCIFLHITPTIQFLYMCHVHPAD